MPSQLIKISVCQDHFFPTIVKKRINCLCFQILFSAWISANITYGLYLSDHSILDAIDTEIVVLSGIMIQNLKRETGWHLRGLRRVGVDHEDAEVVQQCVCIYPSFVTLRDW